MDNLISILKELDPEDQLNTVLTDPDYREAFINCPELLNLKIDSTNFAKFSNESVWSIPFRNISISFQHDYIDIQSIFSFLNHYLHSIESLEFCMVQFENSVVFYNYLSFFPKLNSLKFEKCYIREITEIGQFSNLESVAILNCDESIYKVFNRQGSIIRIKIISLEWSWKGFPHESLNNLLATLPNFNELILEGIGTSSYFELGDFPLNIVKLETYSITFHWYVGIRDPRVNFLDILDGKLKELKIHQLPYDFDGGKVLKYIFENMKLDKFTYGNIPLLLNNQKQEVEEFSASEIQLTSAFEILRQYPGIKKFTLMLNDIDVDSGEIENTILNAGDIFNNLKEFEVIDNSGFKRLFSIFIDLYKKLINIEKIIFKTLDRNINIILEESLPYMTKLKEIDLNSTSLRAEERFKIIKKAVPNLKKISFNFS